MVKEGIDNQEGVFIFSTQDGEFSWWVDGNGDLCFQEKGGSKFKSLGLLDFKTCEPLEAIESFESAIKYGSLSFGEFLSNSFGATVETKLIDKLYSQHRDYFEEWDHFKMGVNRFSRIVQHYLPIWEKEYKNLVDSY